MALLKNEFTRFFVLGFAGGAALVLGAMGMDAATQLADGIVPSAHAAVIR